MSSTTAAPDLAKTAPRSGREMTGRYAWLARLADKARAEHAGTNGDYMAYCPLSKGFLDRAGVSENVFEQMIEQGASDEQLVTYFDKHVSDEAREKANAYILQDSKSHLDEQDREEGRA